MPIPLLDSEVLFGIIANHQLYLQTFGFYELNFKKSAEPSHEPTTFLHQLKKCNTMEQGRRQLTKFICPRQWGEEVIDRSIGLRRPVE